MSKKTIKELSAASEMQDKLLLNLSSRVAKLEAAISDKQGKHSGEQRIPDPTRRVASSDGTGQRPPSSPVLTSERIAERIKNAIDDCAALPQILSDGEASVASVERQINDLWPMVKSALGQQQAVAEAERKGRAEAYMDAYETVRSYSLAYSLETLRSRLAELEKKLKGGQ